MPTRVRSYSKINLGLAIGPPRPDGFHLLSTLYQTLALHDYLTVTAVRAPATRIQLSSNDARVPLDGRNTAWKMVERTLTHLNLTAEVQIRIHKNLPIQGGMGAGSANAAATLYGLERELDIRLEPAERLHLAADVGSDVPLFLVGGSVLGSGRGETVQAVPDVTLGGRNRIPCVVALPALGVSTPQAFRAWDAHRGRSGSAAMPQRAGRGLTPDLHKPPVRDTLEELSRTFASVFHQEGRQSESGASGIVPDSSSALWQNGPENQHGRSSEQLHARLDVEDMSRIEFDLAENSLLALVRTGIENDFETVVFPQYPSLREIKRQLMGTWNAESAAVYAALSGSGSALFGLYRSDSDASAAQHRLLENGVKALVTTTMPRSLFQSQMFAE